MGATRQLRVYKIAAGKLDEFVREWRAGVAPIREKYAFHAEAAWTVDGEDRFVWILRYDGDESFDEADAAYYDSYERRALQPNPARHIVEQVTYMITPI